MKKISTLALALIAMGSLSMPASAQVTFEPVSSIDVSGWYQMRQVKSVQNSAVTSESPKYVFSNETKGYSWFGTSDTQKEDATAFIYIDKGAADYGIQNINGKWGKSKAEATDTRSGMSINVASAEDKTFTVGNYWDDYNTGVMGGFGSSTTATFQFSKVSDEALAAYDVYTVEIKGDITTGSVSSTIEANKGTKTVYPGGSFFFTAGTSLTVNDFSAPDVTDYRKTITVDKNDKKIVVAYQYSYTLDELKATANELLSHKGAGYPIEGAAARATLAQAVAEATSALDLDKAIKLYKGSKTEIQMPEDGKVYVFTNVQKNGARYYLKYENDKLNIFERGDVPAESLAAAAKFVCRVVNGKYVFVNIEDGKYLVWVGMGSDSQNGTNSAKGYLTAYKADWTNMTVTSNMSIYGCLNFGGKRYEDATKNQSNFILKVENGKVAYDAYNTNELVNDKHSTAFRFEEVSYPNTVTFNTVSDVEGVSNLATFSAPFATVIPTGVKAYYVSTADNSQATMKAVEGEAIPAKTGVLLTSESGDAVTMVPATDETLATIENNKLGNSAGAEKTIAEGDNAYILAGGANGTAFYKGKANTTLGMNKAYLTLDTAGGEQAISMNFGGNVTGINQIVNAEQNNAPVYDLTGRRVVRTVKGGLYIKGGNKFIAR